MRMLKFMGSTTTTTLVAVNGIRPYGEGRTDEAYPFFEAQTGPCATPNWFICGDWSQPYDCRDPFSCENTGGFKCEGVGHSCYGSFDQCALIFDCASFGCVPSGGFNDDGCNNFNCGDRYYP